MGILTGLRHKMNYLEELRRLISVGIEEKNGRFAYVVVSDEVAEFTYVHLVRESTEILSAFSAEVWICDSTKSVGGYDFSIDIIAVDKDSRVIDHRLLSDRYDIISYDDISLEQYIKDRKDVR